MYWNMHQELITLNTQSYGESSPRGQFIQEFTAILYKDFTVSCLKYLLPGDLHSTVSSLRL